MAWQWCSYAISPVDGAGPPIYDNDFALPIITEGTCETTFGNLGKVAWGTNTKPRDDTEMITATDAAANAKRNANKNAALQDGAEEVCKNLADDNDKHEDKFTWAGRCAGITRRTKDAKGERNDKTWKKCWEPKKESTPTHRLNAEHDPLRPHGCYLTADMRTLNWNRDTSQTTNCSVAFPCVCAVSNGYCDPKKYYLPSPAEKWLQMGYGTDINGMSPPVIAYAPDTPETKVLMETYLMEQIVANMGEAGASAARMKAYNSEAEIENVHQKTPIAAAILFTDGSPLRGAPSKLELSTNLSAVNYVIRMASDLPWNGWLTTATLPALLGTKPLSDNANPYLSGNSHNGFLFLQAGIERALARHFHPTNMPPTTYARLKSFPYPVFTEYAFINISGSLVTFFIGVISIMIAISNLIVDIVTEKSERQKEVMKMMGANDKDIWASWIIKWTLQLALISTLVTVVLFVPSQSVIKFSSGFIFFLFYFSYAISCMAFGCLMSTLFQDPTLASIAGTIALYLTYIPWEQLSRVSDYETGKRPYDELTFGAKFGVAFMPLSGFGQAMDLIGRYEIKGVAATFGNSFTGPNQNEDFGLGHVILMFWAGTAVWSVAAWYCDNVLQGEYGTSKHPLFFLGCFGIGKPSDSQVQVSDKNNGGTPIHTGTNIGIKISNVVKQWNTPNGMMTAVDNLSLDVKKGEITVLLGHNGAGKTTAMNIMCGMYPPTAGSVLINGHNVANSMDDARESLGLCPQFDIIWKKLTVRMHLDMYCRLKGLTDEDYITQEIETFLIDLNLKDKEDELADTLSGGQKRCLSCSIAFIGGSQTVILDEPTSGMDPEKRRLAWGLITKHRRGRTILLTTHFMDEADLLGDRIAIMHHGQLAAAGSSLELKKEYGSGYKLTVAKADGFHESAAIALVNEAIDGAKLVDNSLDSELCFNLPDHMVGKFPALFKQLEDSKDTLGLDSFGVSCTTIEEVFLKVGEDGLPEGNETEGLDENEFLLGKARVTEDGVGIDSEKETGWSLWTQQFRALFYKRYIDAKRSKFGTLLKVLLPAVLVLVGFATAKFAPVSEMEAVEVSCRTLSFNANSASATFDQTVYLSGADTTYDKFADAHAEIQEGFDSLSNVSATDAQQNLYNRASEFLINKGVKQVNFTGQSFSGKLLEAFDGFGTSRIFEKDKIGATFGQGVTWITSTSGGDCAYSSYPEYSAGTDKESTAFTSDGIKLKPDVWYTFAFDASVNPSSFGATATVTAASTGAELWTSGTEYRLAATIDAAAVPDGIAIIGHMGYESFNVSKYIQGLTEDNEDNDKMASEYEQIMAEEIERASDSLTGPDSRLPVLRLKFEAGTAESVNLRCSSGGSGASGSGDSNSNAVAVSAADVDSTSFVPPTTVAFAWHTRQQLHASPEALNFVGNVIAKEHLDDNDAEFIPHVCPLPKSLQQQSTLLTVSNSVIQLTIMLIFGISGYVSTVILFPFAERKSHAKHVQFVSGASDVVYWTSSFTWDFLVGSLVVVLAAFLAIGFNLDTLQDELIGYFSAVLFLTMWATIPLVYIGATVLPVQSKATAFALTFFFFFQVTIIAFFVLLFTRLFIENVTTRGRLDSADIGLMINPIYAMCKAVYTMTNNAAQLQIVEAVASQGLQLEQLGIEIVYQENYLAWGLGGIGKHLLFLALDGLVYWIVLFYIEWSARQQSTKKREETATFGGDEDVAAEQERILAGSSQDVVVVKGISKTFGGGLAFNCNIEELVKRRGMAKNEMYACATMGFSRCMEFTEGKDAVTNLSFGIPAGECFGLLGVNGAGKTTTFEMLTGEKMLTSGSVEIKGMDLAENMHKIRQHIGYCPQYDGLVGSLTGREALSMFARLRGVPEAKIDDLVESAINALALAKFSGQQCGTYSGGNKRKLSTAIAIIGAPDIIFLDEPTSGMDPKSRRFLWNVLLAIRRSGKIIILTSHSMEECEALCSKVVIMKAGQFQCIGSPQHLKSKYGSGYTVTARLAQQPNGEPADTAALRKMFEANFKDAEFEKDVYGEVSYTVSKATPLSTIFDTLEFEKVALKIEDYSVNQTSLEQVFLKFAGNEDGDVDGDDDDDGAGGGAKGKKSSSTSPAVQVQPAAEEEEVIELGEGPNAAVPVVKITKITTL